MDKFDWKNGLFIMAAVVLNCVVCGALMRPLVPTKKPRKKNFFDRFVSSILPSYNVFLAELYPRDCSCSGNEIMKDIVIFLSDYEQQEVTVWGYE